MLFHLQFGSKGGCFPFPVGEHGGGRHQQHRALQFLFGLEVLQEGQQLNGFAQAHVVGQASALVKAMQEGQPAQASLLVGPELAAESFGSGQGIGSLLLVVLLQHRLQARTSLEPMHRHPHQGVAFGGRQAQGVIKAEIGVGSAEAFGVFEVVGAQFDPGPLVAHQGAALAR